MAVSKFCNAFEALRDGWSGAAPGAWEAAVLLICSVIYCIYSFHFVLGKTGGEVYAASGDRL